MHVAVLIGGNDYRQRTVYAEREAATLSYVVEEMRRFHRDHLATGIPPARVGDPDVLIDLDERLHPDRTGIARLDLAQSVDALALRDEYGEVHDEVTAKTKRKKAIQAEMIALLDGREIAVADDQFLFSYEKKAGAPKVDLERLSERFPDAYEQCVTHTSHRTFNAGLRRRKGSS
jgi:predicted phage-related endonuclease